MKNRLKVCLAIVMVFSHRIVANNSTTANATTTTSTEKYTSISNQTSVLTPSIDVVQDSTEGGDCNTTQ